MNSISKLAAIAASATLLAAVPAHAITINAIFASGCSTCGFAANDMFSLSTLPGAEAAVIAADDQIASQFGGDLTSNIVYIGVHGGANGFFARTKSGLVGYTYNDYVTALTADASLHPNNVVLNTAVANLKFGNGYGDPTAFVALTTSAARNLGLGNAAPALNYGPGTVDSVVFLNVDAPLSFTRPIQDVSAGVVYDVETAMEHETDEVLGIGGAASTLNNFQADVYGPMDLYRYSAPGTPSFDPTDAIATYCEDLTSMPCTDGPSPYFSVDGGKTSIDIFNQMFPDIGGDAGDWGIDLSTAASYCPGNAAAGGTGDVQDAFVCNNRSPNVAPGTPSYEALESIGYNPVPEPATWTMMLIGLGGLGVAMRSGRRQTGATA